MPLTWLRVDDRLIHGQVVEGWLRDISVDRVVVACDRASCDDLQIGLMRLALPADLALDVLPVARAAELFLEGAWEKERVFVLIPGISELDRLLELGLPVACANIGGLHDAPGRTRWGPHLFLTSQEKDRVMAIEEKNVYIDCRAVPSDPQRPWREWLALGESLAR